MIKRNQHLLTEDAGSLLNDQSGGCVIINRRAIHYFFKRNKPYFIIGIDVQLALHRKLDALTGCSPNKFIRIIRLNKAKEMLKDPASSIAFIAYECGYNDPGYFARVFKQEHGETPQAWRTVKP